MAKFLQQRLLSTWAKPAPPVDSRALAPSHAARMEVRNEINPRSDLSLHIQCQHRSPQDLCAYQARNTPPNAGNHARRCGCGPESNADLSRAAAGCLTRTRRGRVVASAARGRRRQRFENGAVGKSCMAQAVFSSASSSLRPKAAVFPGPDRTVPRRKSREGIQRCLARTARGQCVVKRRRRLFEPSRS